MKKLLFFVFLHITFSLSVFSQATPTPTPIPGPIPKIVSGGVVNGKAIKLVKPSYPSVAKSVRASGIVNVQVTISENGDVISASAVSGHPLLRQAAESAARQTKFGQTTLSGQAVKVTGVLVYNFIDDSPPAPVAEKMDYEKTRYILLGLIMETLSKVDYEPEIKAKLDEMATIDPAYKAMQIEFLKQYETLTLSSRNAVFSKKGTEIKLKLKDFDLWQYQVGENSGAIFAQLRNLAANGNYQINWIEAKKNVNNLRELAKNPPPDVTNEFIKVMEYYISEFDKAELDSREGKGNLIALVEMILQTCGLVE